MNTKDANEIVELFDKLIALRIGTQMNMENPTLLEMLEKTIERQKGRIATLLVEIEPRENASKNG